jgi:hypothetical protein
VDQPEFKPKERGAESPASWMIANVLDKVSSRTEGDFRTRTNESGRDAVCRALGLAGIKCAHSKKVLRTGGRGAVEVAFDDENGCIVAKVIAAKICSSVIDIGYEILGRK